MTATPEIESDLPTKCPGCGLERITASYEVEELEYGRDADVIKLKCAVVAWKCADCDTMFTDSSAEDAREAVIAAYKAGKAAAPQSTPAEGPRSNREDGRCCDGYKWAVPGHTKGCDEATTAVLNAPAPRQPLDVEKRLRQELWLNHGHGMPYGDDGEMQCSACEHWDYKRTTIDTLVDQVDRQRLVNAAQAQQARTKVAAEPAPQVPGFSGSLFEFAVQGMTPSAPPGATKPLSADELEYMCRYLAPLWPYNYPQDRDRARLIATIDHVRVEAEKRLEDTEAERDRWKQAAELEQVKVSGATKEWARWRERAETAEREVKALKEAASPLRTMEELEAACRNVGVDLQCGACAENFFCSGSSVEHTPECRRDQSAEKVATELEETRKKLRNVQEIHAIVMTGRDHEMERQVRIANTQRDRAQIAEERLEHARSQIRASEQLLHEVRAERDKLVATQMDRGAERAQLELDLARARTDLTNMREDRDGIIKNWREEAARLEREISVLQHLAKENGAVADRALRALAEKRGAK